METADNRLQVSIGVCAYNEELNIGTLLEALLTQQTQKVNIAQIIVVSSACDDTTDQIVQSFQDVKDSRVQLIKQSERRGKASAINLFLRKATGDICVLESADTLPEEDTIETLCNPFFDQRVGMTGGRPVPVDDPSIFLGFVTHFVWSLHHKIACIEPKLGELVAFRNIIRELPENTAVDEACVEQIIRQAGYNIRYAPLALVRNKGPENLHDFLCQRRRIFNGHLQLQSQTDYQVSTMNQSRIFKLAIQDIQRTPKGILWATGAMVLEAYARLLGAYDFHIKKRNPYVWDIASSTKNLNIDNDRDTATDSPI